MKTPVTLGRKCPFVAYGPLSPIKMRVETAGRNGGVHLGMEGNGKHLLSPPHSMTNHQSYLSFSGSVLVIEND